ncbi:MAG: hypothetical protein HOI23_03470 [Deltaproteobacteria bacterium]|jgi:hypothetical protein|nr:hypothetical protein [Deltaproteobacteria bacterium]MBT6432285.1 hypothetical protein [Deltaproteobacteria bacterium]MBT6491377.1 hypothetical protein [Deltaproteobacteria bacterium]
MLRVRFFLLTAGLVATTFSTAYADEPSRDDDVFDEESREDDMFGGGEDSDSDAEARLDNKLEEKDDLTQIGGFLYLQLNYSTYEEGEPADYALQSPALFDLYMDSRPTERIRAYARGRIVQQLTAGSSAFDSFDFDFADSQPASNTQASLDQLWLKFDIARTVYVTVGKQPVRWGTGRFWNPTDFLQAQVRDPLAVFDTRQGVSLLKLHMPFEELGWNLYGAINLQELATPRDIAGALRAEFLFDTTEISLSAAARNAGLKQFGLDFSTAFFDLDVRGEVAVSNKVQTAFFEGTLSDDFAESMLNAEYDIGEFPTLVGRKNDWIVQAVFGAELAIKYSDEDSLILGLEYFFNDAGYDDSSIYPWLIAVASPDIQASLNSINYGDGRLSNFDTASSFKPLYLGRHYLALSAILMAPGSWNNTTLVFSGLCNLSDKSLIVRGDYRIRVLTQLDLGAYITVHTGKTGEFRMDIPVSNDAEGVALAAQLVDIGASLRVSF